MSLPPSYGTGRTTGQRLIAFVIAVFASWYALAMLLGQFQRPDVIGFGIGMFVAAIAAGCWWFALQGQLAEIRRVLRWALIGGLVVGSIGFVIGFFGPLVWAPEANQGPLLGIFVTGPLGFVLGAVGGLMWAMKRKKPKSPPPANEPLG